MLTILAPWSALVARANPDFLWYFFVREHLLRFTGQRYPRDEFLSAPIFLAFALLWTFPWMALIPQAVAGAFRRLRIGEWRKTGDLLPFLWGSLVIGLFTASSSRMEYYSLPAIPAFALLLGKLWDEALKDVEEKRPAGFAVFPLASTGIVLLLATGAAWILMGSSKGAIFHFIKGHWPWSDFSEGHGIMAWSKYAIPRQLFWPGRACSFSGLPPHCTFLVRELPVVCWLGL